MAATKTVTKTAPASKNAAKTGSAKAAGKAEQPVAKAPAKAAPASVKAPPKAEKAKPAPAAKSAIAAKAASPTKAAAPVKPAAKAASPAKATPAPAPMKATDTKPAKSSTKPVEKPAAPKAAAKPASKSAKKTAQVLTEAELLAMSDDDYMNEAQLAFFRAKLEAMREEMLDNARETGEHLKENEVFADPNDRATVEEENMLEQRVRDRERKLLKKIESTLNRIESGDYGYCKETGEPIGLPRLLARPTADLSIEAQEKHERLEKLYAD